MADRIDKEARKLGQTLKYYREVAGVTRQEIADATGLGRNYISSIERGVHKCNAATFITYGRKCGVSLDKIAGLGSSDNLIPELKEKLSVMDKEQQKRVSAMIDLMK